MPETPETATCTRCTHPGSAHEAGECWERQVDGTQCPCDWYTSETTMRPEDDEAARFWARVRKTETCWIWDAGGDRKGYGKFYVGRGINRQAHRWAWESINGPIPDGMLVRHTCDNPPCVNPAHLEVGTQLDNMRDAVERGRIRRGDDHPTRRDPSLVTRGEQRTQAKLTEAQVTEIRALAAEGIARRKIARMFDIAEVTVRKIVNRETWSHVA